MDKEKSIGIKDYFLLGVFVVKHVYAMSPKRVIIMIVLDIIRQGRPLITAAFLAAIIDKAVQLAAEKGNPIEILPLVILWLSTYTVFDIITNLYRYARRTLYPIFNIETDRMLYTKLHALGIQAEDRPAIKNLSQRIMDNQSAIMNAFITITESISQLAAVIVAGVTVFSFMPYVVPLLLVFVLVKIYPGQVINKRLFKWNIENTERRRIAYNYGWTLTNVGYIGETSILNAFQFFSKKHTTASYDYIREQWKFIDQSQAVEFTMNTVETLVDAVIYFSLFASFIRGDIATVGTLIFRKGAYDQYSSSLAMLYSSLSMIADYALKNSEIKTFYEMKPFLEDGKRLMLNPGKAPEIEFRNVSFSYPGKKQQVLKNVSFKISAGEKIALVGHNGVGKTTLVKLIARMYDPTAGQILINGRDLKTIKSKDWFKHISVMFQDFNIYSVLSIKENIALGDPTKKPDIRKIREAAKKSDADKFIMELPLKYNQLLSSSFKDGITTSTGQAQKIALARFFYRNAPLVIFDEPTAAIDAVAEHKIFNKIYKFFVRKTVIIISHRFSTVKNADRIIVMEKGKVIEEGSHRELMTKKGVYEHAFSLQASAYRDEDSTQTSEVSGK